MISKKQSELIANKKSAFTLMEIIIAAGVLAIFIGGLMSLFGWKLHDQQKFVAFYGYKSVEACLQTDYNLC